MANVVERPSMAYFKCPNPGCEKMIEIYPVFHKYHKKLHEAWAVFWFEKGETGRERCKILYNHEELTPNEAAEKITRGSVNAWTFWKFDSGKDIVTLSKLADRINGSRL